MLKLLPLIISRMDVLCFQVVRKLAQNEIKIKGEGQQRGEKQVHVTVGGKNHFV